MANEVDAADLRILTELARQELGHKLSGDPALIHFRLSPILACHGLRSIQELTGRLRVRREPSLITAVCEALLNHETSFFREPNSFVTLRTKVLPGLVEKRRSEGLLRIWSAASSSGQEAYSLAMLLMEHFPLLNGWDVRILATDISQVAIDRGRSGIYNSFEVQRGLSMPQILRHFVKRDETWEVNPELRRRVRFERLNLLDEGAALSGPFDIVLLRHVLIYLDEDSRARVLERVRKNIQTDGFLLLGGAESVMELNRLFAQSGEAGALYVPRV